MKRRLNAGCSWHGKVRICAANILTLCLLDLHSRAGAESDQSVLFVLEVDFLAVYIVPIDSWNIIPSQVLCKVGTAQAVRQLMGHALHAPADTAENCWLGY